MRIGILGYPQSGKTTLFNVLAKAHASTGAFASGSGGVNIGTVQVPDPRLEALRDMFRPKKYTPARIEYVDLAGAEGHKKEALLPQQITASDLILLVVRDFEDPGVHHPRGSVDPVRDAGDLADELALKDMAVLEGRIERLRKSKQVGAKDGVSELPLLERCLAALEEGRPLRELELTSEEEKTLRGYQLVTQKPLLVVCNVGEGDAGGNGPVKAPPESPKMETVRISGKAEMEIAELEGDEQRDFMELLGIRESGLARVIRASYRLLGVCSFFTVGEDEVRAWTIGRGTRAVEAAGTIHSDLQRGFIRAEVIPAADLLEAGSLPRAKEKHLMRVEGKEYVVADGDVLNIRFNV
jgi:hypothetical protein